MSRFQWFLSWKVDKFNGRTSLALDLIPCRLVDSPELVIPDDTYPGRPWTYVTYVRCGPELSYNYWERWSETGLSKLISGGWEFTPISKQKAKLLYKTWRADGTQRVVK